MKLCSVFVQYVASIGVESAGMSTANIQNTTATFAHFVDLECIIAIGAATNI